MSISNGAGFLTIATISILFVVYKIYKSRLLNRQQGLLNKPTASELKKQRLDKRKQSYLAVQKDVAKLQDIDTLLKEALAKHRIEWRFVAELHTTSINKATAYVKEEYAQKRERRVKSRGHLFADDFAYDTVTMQIPDPDNPGNDINGFPM